MKLGQDVHLNLAQYLLTKILKFVVVEYSFECFENLQVNF